jgi:hypothetical protein
MKRTFAALMKLYPPEYQGLFADEMASVFEDARRDWRARGWCAYVLFLAAELAGILHGAAVARSARFWNARPIAVILPFLAGGIVSMALLRTFLYYVGDIGRFLRRASYRHDEMTLLLTLTAVSVLMIAGFSVAFVVNLKLVTGRRHSKV